MKYSLTRTLNDAHQKLVKTCSVCGHRGIDDKPKSFTIMHLGTPWMHFIVCPQCRTGWGSSKSMEEAIKNYNNGTGTRKDFE